MPEAVPPPLHDRALEGEAVPSVATTRSIDDLVPALMEVWDCSKPAVERRIDARGLDAGQCQWLVWRRWGAV